VMQVHYNLLAGTEPDVSATQLRLSPMSKKLTELHTMLLPGPVELPCRPGRGGQLCDRSAAVDDVVARFGARSGATANFLHLLCDTTPQAGATQSCVRKVDRRVTIRATGGHMHLLGREISIEVNPGTSRARTILDIPVWNFDDQGADPIDPVTLDPGDTVKVTCRHDQAIRDELPELKDAVERYVVWGEGTTDEMCLGVLTVTYP
jgi:hypothetical protein